MATSPSHATNTPKPYSVQEEIIFLRLQSRVQLGTIPKDPQAIQRAQPFTLPLDITPGTVAVVLHKIFPSWALHWVPSPSPASTGTCFSLLSTPITMGLWVFSVLRQIKSPWQSRSASSSPWHFHFQLAPSATNLLWHLHCFSVSFSPTRSASPCLSVMHYVIFALTNPFWSPPPAPSPPNDSPFLQFFWILHNCFIK